MNRRLVLKKAFSSLCQFTGLFILVPGCGQNQENNYRLENLTDCRDLSGLDEEELNKRKSLGYQEISPIPENTCDNCQLYLPAHENSHCGGCQLFKGPVLKNAYCTYWAPRTALV